MAIGYRRDAAMPARAHEGGAVGQLLLHGAIGGLLAGIIFALFEMAVAAVKMGVLDAAWMPLRMIGATVLGEDALMPGYSLAKAATTGLLVHMMLSALFGVAFAVLLVVLPALKRSAPWLVGAATAYGLLLWLVNFYVIARVAGWDWFPDGADQFWQGFIAHTFVFGTLLGVYLVATLRRRAEESAR